MRIKLWIMMAASCGMLALIGCTTYPEGPYVAVAKPGNPEASGKPVVLLNSSLVQRLAVDLAPNVSRNANGLLEIQVGLRNRTDDEKLQLQVQTLFFNDSRHVLYSEPGSEAAWQMLTLAPNQTTYYTQQAFTPEATRYVVRVRQFHGHH